MPEIEVTADQRDRLRDLQRRLEAEMASQYATVRAGDAVAYLLDRYAAEGEVVLDGDPRPTGGDTETGASADDDASEAGGGDGEAAERAAYGTRPSGGRRRRSAGGRGRGRRE